MVSEELICPDCGGVVGATKTTEAGPPCRCFSAPNDKSDTVADAPFTPAGESTEEPAPVAKICRICGKDVAGKKRVKDHLGYYCVECSREEDKKAQGGRVRCRVCGHLVKEENLILYEGTKMCATCHRERIDLQKTEIKRLGFKGARTRAELQRIYVLAISLLVLSLVMGYGLYRTMRH